MTTYPISLPAQGIATITIRPCTAGSMTSSVYTGSQEVTSFPGQWWEADVTFARASMAAAGAIEAFFCLLNGPSGTFLMGDPMRPVPFGQAASFPGTPLVNGAQAVGASVLNVKGAPASKTKWLLAGDLIQLGSGLDTHLHKVCQDADTDGSGDTALTIWPFLREPVSDGDTLVISACKGIFRIPNAKPAWARSPGPKTDAGFSAIEAI